jgi:hypothetical protein
LSYAWLLSNPYWWSLLWVWAGMFWARKLYTDVIPNLYSTICTKSSLCYKWTKKWISNIMPWNWWKKK